MRRLIYIIVGLLIVIGCDTENNIANPVESYFIKYYGAEGDQEGVDMIINSDGTYVLLGTSESSLGDKQIFIVKVNAIGEVLWEQMIGDALMSEIAVDMELMLDNSIVILYNTITVNEGTDLHVSVIDQNGEIVQNPIGDITSFFGYENVSGEISDEVGTSITPLVDNGSPAGFIVAGYSNCTNIPQSNGGGISALFVRFNPDGSILGSPWVEFYSSAQDDYSVKVVQVDDLSSEDPYLIFGYTNSNLSNTNSSFNYWSSKLSNNGSALNVGESSIIENSPINTDEILSSVTYNSPTITANFLMTGLAISSTDSKIFVASRTNFLPEAKSIDGITLGNLGSNDNKALLKVSSCLSGSSYLLAANSISSGNSNIILTKVDAGGSVLWNSPVILGGSGEDYVAAVNELDDKRILVFGTVSIGDDGQKKMALFKLNKNGEFKK